VVRSAINIVHLRQSCTSPDFNRRFLRLSSFLVNDPTTTEIYTLSLHDALPISDAGESSQRRDFAGGNQLRRLLEIIPSEILDVGLDHQVGLASPVLVCVALHDGKRAADHARHIIWS